MDSVAPTSSPSTTRGKRISRTIAACASMSPESNAKPGNASASSSATRCALMPTGPMVSPATAATTTAAAPMPSCRSLRSAACSAVSAPAHVLEPVVRASVTAAFDQLAAPASTSASEMAAMKSTKRGPHLDTMSSLSSTTLPACTAAS